MKEKLISFKNWFLEVMGIGKNSKFVSNYLNEANIRTSIYMSFIIVALELWMIIRSGIKNVAPKVAIDIGNGVSPITSIYEQMFRYTSLYWLLLFCGLTMMIFSILYFKFKGRKSVPALITLLVLGGICFVYSFFVFKEHNVFHVPADTPKRLVNKITIVTLYVTLLIFGLVVIAYALNKFFHNKHMHSLSLVLSIVFAIMCLSFGVKVSYSDFFTSTNAADWKMIICFLTMVLYVACLLIWRPYISIIMLVALFVGFDFLLASNPDFRPFLEGDRINYITFLICLAMISVSIYNQRLNEAKKDEQLERKAKEDDLTGINNYSHFLDLCQEIINNDREDLKDKIYLFINIQNFKNYNDKFGFQKGNELLAIFAKSIEKIFAGDPVGRNSDDHFVAFTSINGLEDKMAQTSKVLTDLAQGLFMEAKFGGYKFIYPKEESRHAIDKARYAASLLKQMRGKNYKEFTQDMGQIYEKRQYIINNIDKAVKEGYIKVYYQPVVWSDDKTLCGCEALARWIDPIYGFLPPGEFVPVLEELRLIDKLDRAIYEIVCRDIRNSLDKNEPTVPVSINFSRLDFELMDAISEFESMVAKYNVPKEYLHVEITESALTENQDLLLSSVERIHQDGYALWLDDFGSGYSSLNTLKSFNFDLLKIDMAFLKNFEQYPKTKGILLTIIELANRLGMKTLTEGVETYVQADYLKEIGCGRLQGYLFGKPLSIEELKQGIAEGKYILSDEII